MDQFWIDFGVQMEPKLEPKWGQKGTENRSTQRIAFLIDFGSSQEAAIAFDRVAGGAFQPPQLLAQDISDMYRYNYNCMCNISYKLICYKDM